MKNKISILTAAGVFLCLTFFVIGYVVGNHGNSSPDRRLEEYPTTGNNDLVNMLPGTEPEYLCDKFWSENISSELLYTPEEIKNFNDHNAESVLYINASGFERRLRQRDITDTLEGLAVRSLIEVGDLDSWMSSDSAYINGKPASAEIWERYKYNQNMDNVPETVDLRFAVCVEWTVSKLVPSDDFLAFEQDEKYINRFVSAEIFPGAAVVVLHESADNEWYYVLAGSYCGWVRKETIAVCADREAQEAICDPEKFIIVTGNRLIFDETASDKDYSGRILPMGVKLKLTDNPPESVDGRSTYGCYVVDIPVRAEDGYMLVEQALVPVSRDVHVGYLNMTSEAVLTQAFKFLGQIYGWGGSLSSNDCSGYIRQVYSCFGFELPRNSAAIARIEDLGAFYCAEMSVDRKLETLRKMPAGLLLHMDGHLMIYLGMVENVPYVISSCSTFIPEGTADISPDKIIHANCVMVSSMNLLRTNGNTWLEDMNYFDWKEF